jgi:hypothetical protein
VAPKSKSAKSKPAKGKPAKSKAAKSKPAKSKPAKSKASLDTAATKNGASTPKSAATVVAPGTAMGEPASAARRSPRSPTLGVDDYSDIRKASLALGR